MSVVLKRPVADSPGILVFTHKERVALGADIPVIGEQLRQLRRRYLLGMHWGWLNEDVPRMEHIDFHLGYPDTVTFKDESQITRLKYNSSTFIPAVFRPRPEVPKQWDVLTVARTLKMKRNDQFLQALRLVYDERPQTRTLLVITAPSKFNKKHHHNLPELFEQLFSAEEREQISFIYVQGDNIRPIARDDMAFLFAASRVFCLFSEVEGESRVIKEAMVSGLPVVADANLLGGGRQFFAEHNSRVFRTVPEAAQKMLELLRLPVIDTRPEEIAVQISERHTVARFEADLRTLIESRGLPCEGPFLLHDLSIRLPAHDLREECARLTSGPTADLKDALAMAQFLQSLIDETPLLETSLTSEQQVSLRNWLLAQADVGPAKLPQTKKSAAKDGVSAEVRGRRRRIFPRLRKALIAPIRKRMKRLFTA